MTQGFLAATERGWMPGWPGPWWLWVAVSVLAVVFFLSSGFVIYETWIGGSHYSFQSGYEWEPEGLGFAILAAWVAAAMFFVASLYLAALISAVVGAVCLLVYLD